MNTTAGGGRKPNPLLQEFIDDSIPLPPLHWETVPADVDPHKAWEALEENVDGWVPAWFPTGDPKSGRSYGEFERSYYFNADLERILTAMHRWPLWGSAKQKKHSVAIALLQLYCEVMQRCPKV